MLPSRSLPSPPLRNRRLAMALQILPSRAATNLLDTLPLTPTLGPRGPKATSAAQASSSRAQTLVMAQKSLTVAAASMQTSDSRVQRSWTWARATMATLVPTSRRGPPTSLRSKPATALPTSWPAQAQSQRAAAPRQRPLQFKFTVGTRTTTTTTATTSSVVPKLRLAIRAHLAKSLVMLLPLFLPLRRTMTTTTTTTSADSLELQPRNMLPHRRTLHRSLPPAPALVVVAMASVSATTTMTTSGNSGRPLLPCRLLLPRARAAALGTKMRRTRTGASRARVRRLLLRHHSRPPCPRHRPLCLSSRELLSSCLPRQRLVQMRGARRRGGEICAVTSYRCSRPRRPMPRTSSPTAPQIGTSGFSETPAFQRRPGSSSHWACRTWSCQRYPSWRWACRPRTSGPSSRVPA
mmetsp:Transcript_68794/g.197263  ORF Transcript_68794/g.197263 Transcript_68794/m.197263 type:complete len:408 (-) Transcript_68794:711-1934(-)